MYEIVEELDLVCLMSVNPGFGGQKFIESTYRKIQELRDMAAGRNDDLFVEIDGGVTLQNASQLLESGADVLVAGNTVFGSSDPVQTISDLKDLKK